MIVIQSFRSGISWYSKYYNNERHVTWHMFYNDNSANSIYYVAIIVPYVTIIIPKDDG